MVIKAYVRSGIESNIVAVPWSHLSTPGTLLGEGFYKPAALNVKQVARNVADFIILRPNNGFVCAHDQVLIGGCSLGANMAGKAGRYVFLDTGNLINRITCLDPTGPDFDIKTDTVGRLNKDNAEFVDILRIKVNSNITRHLDM